MNTETICKVIDMDKTYKKKKILNKCCLNINKGEIYGLIGKNGAGKTTLMRILMGLSTAEKGKIEILGSTNPTALSDSRKRMSAFINPPAFYTYMTAYENLKMHQCLLFGKTDRQKVKSALTKVGLLQDGDKKVKNYSLGMKQRLGLARALSSNAEFIILDEPTNGLDLEGIRLLRELIAELNREQDITFLISGHHITELDQLATVFGILNDGKIVLERQTKRLHEEIKQSRMSLEDFVWNWMK